MTTKFSQVNGTQALPPVCRSGTIPIDRWTPPLHPDLVGFVQASFTKPDSTVIGYERQFRLPWSSATLTWDLELFPPDFYLRIRIHPNTPPDLVTIATITWMPGAITLNYSWFPPPYTPGEPWESGPHLETQYAPYRHCWQTFATYTG